MKRTTASSVYEVAIPVDQKVPISKVPGEAKVIWHSDPAALVGPREEEQRRKAPEMRVLYIVSACLTLMVLWGLFREARVRLPGLFGSAEVSEVSSVDMEESNITADSLRVNSVGDSMTNVAGRKEGKHLLQFQEKEVLWRYPHRFGTFVEDDQHQSKRTKLESNEAFLKEASS